MHPNNPPFFTSTTQLAPSDSSIVPSYLLDWSNATAPFNGVIRVFFRQYVWVGYMSIGSQYIIPTTHATTGTCHSVSHSSSSHAQSTMCHTSVRSLWPPWSLAATHVQAVHWIWWLHPTTRYAARWCCAYLQSHEKYLSTTTTGTVANGGVQCQWCSVQERIPYRARRNPRFLWRRVVLCTLQVCGGCLCCHTIRTAYKQHPPFHTVPTWAHRTRASSRSDQQYSQPFPFLL